MLRQLTWSIACICLGATPGLLIYATLKQWFALVVAGLGGVVGFGLSLPNTSFSRVARGTTAAIVAKNVPLLGSKAWDALLGKSQDQKDEQAACDHFRKLPECDLVTVTDVAAETQRRIEANGITSIDDVRHASVRICAYSESTHGIVTELKGFLNQRLYKHANLVGMSEWADAISFTCEDEGVVVLVELRVKDEAGNETICWTNITTVDKTQPECRDIGTVNYYYDELPSGDDLSGTSAV